MLTIAYLIVETWRLFWKPRAVVVRKSSFRNLQKSERPVVTKRQPQDQSELPFTNQRPSSWKDDLPSEQKSPDSPKSPRYLDQSDSESSPADDKKVIGRGIPVASKHIVPSVSRPIQAQTTSTIQAPPPQAALTPGQQQQQQQPHHTQPSHIPTPIQRSVKTVVLEPSISGNRMDETWAKKQLEKFSFGFDEADKDKSGSLSFEEVLVVLQHNGFNGSKTEAQFIFGLMDKDGNKTVSRDEFNKAMGNVPRMVIRQYVYRKAFQQMDKDKSGYLTKKEIADAAKNEGGIDIGPKVISDLLVYVSKNESDKVEYEEFLRVFGIEATADVLTKAFKAIDKDGSGFLTRNEMLDAVSSEFELKLSAKLISQMLIDLVKDEDQKMSFQEFVESYRKMKERK